MSAPAATRLRIEGVVQGVGFRPFVHGLALRHGLAGWVRNAGDGVEALLEGDDAAIGAFLATLPAQAPPLARIAAVHAEAAPVSGLREFAIVASECSSGTQPVPADVALCADCRRELHDPADRRYRYPFVNCVNCGPRFSVIVDVPYDRERTTMATFAMCAACRREYDDPASRRFHAEPIACADCGPQLAFDERGERAFGEDALARARALLAAGAIVAVKGIGGYHLACDARDAAAVERLRAWKARGAKPLAVMVRDDAELARVASADARERALLSSPAHPVVLLRAQAGSGLAPGIHPGTPWLGVLLPYTPVHELLLAPGAPDVPASIVLTSANRSAQPMIADDRQARVETAGLVAGVLTNDRPIVARVDDSVSRIVLGAEAPLRRARGYAPLPVRLPFDVPPLLACGGDMKNAFALARERNALLSSYAGDLENADTYAEYAAMIERLSGLFRIRPELVAYDPHPNYWSARFARGYAPDVPHVAVPHHHAHVAACMAEHGLRGPAIGIAFDGTGYGDDGALWGGEVFVAGYAECTRAAHLAYVPLYGGANAVREPWRVALAHLRAAGVAWEPQLAPVRAAAPEALRAYGAAHAQSVWPRTSSAGRLFDAVASLLGVCQASTYDGQAAIELEALADPDARTPYDVAIEAGPVQRIDVAPMIAQIVADCRAGAGVAAVSGRFHATLADVVVRQCERLRDERAIGDVVLSGGVFQNARLTADISRALDNRSFSVYRHRLVPANDGGLALGQAAVAGARWARGTLS